jgi:hypothetical protein
MREFLTPTQLKALDRTIAKARAEPGVHREPTRDGEVVAYRLCDEIHFAVNVDEVKLARGTVPLASVMFHSP